VSQQNNSSNANSADSTSSYMNMTEQTLEKTLDAISDNIVKSFEGYRNILPRFYQSVSDFQWDTINSAINTTNKTISYQKKIIKEIVNASQSQPTETYQQLFKKSNENIDNFIKAFYAGNNYNFDTIDNTRENLKIYHKALDTFNEYSTNAFDAWMSFAKSFTNRI
jgi:uncharacterized protein Yka (UPF0111/DUF47 family)